MGILGLWEDCLLDLLDSCFEDIPDLSKYFAYWMLTYWNYRTHVLRICSIHRIFFVLLDVDLLESLDSCFLGFIGCIDIFGLLDIDLF